ncbi:hypothetical protein [Sphingobacterium griseoflavum]|uniref:hypothetical protein n=1 Tax=Sphingobacterium griseoflavum TaxID=1474952 RepID=UPI0016748F7D|nr:hypothetical protein [Sphingobacterium griseoflavum]
MINLAFKSDALPRRAAEGMEGRALPEGASRKPAEANSDLRSMTPQARPFCP